MPLIYLSKFASNLADIFGGNLGIMKLASFRLYFITLCVLCAMLLLSFSGYCLLPSRPLIKISETSNRTVLSAKNQQHVTTPSTSTYRGSDMSGKQKLNVLFLVSDDLRPQINSYRGPHHANPNIPSPAYTPNLDKLAKKSIQMNRAYVQFAVCGPSRASYMTGRRPDTTRVWNTWTYWRDTGGNFTTIPQYFKQNGYKTAGFGKIYHPMPGEAGWDPLSWTEPYGRPQNGTYYQDIDRSWWAVPKNETNQLPMPDEQITAAAIKTLQRLSPAAKSGHAPFFLAVGLKKPHIPFVFPDSYLHMYDLADVGLHGNNKQIVDFPDIAIHPGSFFEPGQYSDIASLGLHGFLNETLPDRQTRELRRAYFSCMSFIDDMVGRILETLDELGLAQNTIVTFIGDHGYHLGENAIWGKHTNLEQSTHAPMMIHIPGLTDHSIQTDSLVEFVDLFPTLAEAAGLEAVPPCPPVSRDIELCTEGVSLMPLVRDPTTVIKTKVFSQIVRRLPEHVMGYAVRTDRYRYVEWPVLMKKKLARNVCVYAIIWDAIKGRELYDHSIDPEENVNRVSDDQYQDIIEYHSKQLRNFVGNNITGICLAGGVKC